MSLSLTILSLLPAAVSVFCRFQGGTSQVKFWQSEHAALMTTCITPPWCHRNSAPPEIGVSWHPDNSAIPSLSGSVSAFPKTICSFGCQNKPHFPATLVWFCLIDLLGPVQAQWLSCTLTERDLAVSHLLPNTRRQMRKYVGWTRSLYNFENWKCKYFPQPLNLSILTIYNSCWVKVLAISWVSILFLQSCVYFEPLPCLESL